MARSSSHPATPIDSRVAETTVRHSADAANLDLMCLLGCDAPTAGAPRRSAMVVIAEAGSGASAISGEGLPVDPVEGYGESGPGIPPPPDERTTWEHWMA